MSCLKNRPLDFIQALYRPFIIALLCLLGCVRAREQQQPKRIDYEGICYIRDVRVNGATGGLIKKLLPRLQEGKYLLFPQDNDLLNKAADLLEHYCEQAVIKVTPKRTSEGVDLIIEITLLRPYPILSRLSYTGIELAHHPQLERDRVLKKNSPLNPANLAAVRQYVLNYFLAQGFYKAQVTLQTQEEPKKTHAQLNITVRKGRRYYLDGVRFHGNQALTTEQLKNLPHPHGAEVQQPNVMLGRLLKDLKQVAIMDTLGDLYRFVTGPDLLVEEQIRHYANAVQQYYHTQGFLKAEVGYKLTKIKPKKTISKTNKTKKSSPSPRVRAHITIKEGPKYAYQITWKGNKAYTQEALNKHLASILPDFSLLYTKLQRLYAKKRRLVYEFKPTLISEEGNVAHFEISLRELDNTKISAIKISPKNTYYKVAQALLAQHGIKKNNYLTFEAVEKSTKALSSSELFWQQEIRLGLSQDQRLTIHAHLPPKSTFSFGPCALFTLGKGEAAIKLGGAGCYATHELDGEVVSSSTKREDVKFRFLYKNKFVVIRKRPYQLETGVEYLPWKGQDPSGKLFLNLGTTLYSLNHRTTWKGKMGYECHATFINPLNKVLIGLAYTRSSTDAPLPTHGQSFTLEPMVVIPAFTGVTANDKTPYLTVTSNYSYYYPLSKEWTLGTKLRGGVAFNPLGATDSTDGRFTFNTKTQDRKEEGTVLIPLLPQALPFKLLGHDYTEPSASNKPVAFVMPGVEFRYSLAADSALSLFCQAAGAFADTLSTPWLGGTAGISIRKMTPWGQVEFGLAGCVKKLPPQKSVVELVLFLGFVDHSE